MKRRTVRLRTLESAEQALAIIRETTHVVGEYQQDEAIGLGFPIEVRSLIPKTVVLVFVPYILVPIAFIAILFYAPSATFSALLVPLIIAYLLYRVIVWVLPGRIIKSSKAKLSTSWLSGPVSGWLLVRDGYVMLKTYYDWIPHEPRRVEWKDSRSFLLRTKTEVMLLSFFKQVEAVETVRSLKEKSSDLQESYLSGYEKENMSLTGY